MKTTKDSKPSRDTPSTLQADDEQTQESFPAPLEPDEPSSPTSSTRESVSSSREKESKALSAVTADSSDVASNRRGGDRRASVNLREEHLYQLELEDRRLRRWLIQALVSCFCIVFIIVIGGMVYSSTTKGTTINDSVLKNFLDTLMEILKVLKPDKPN